MNKNLLTHLDMVYWLFLWGLVLLLSNNSLTYSKPNSIQDVITSKLTLLKAIRDRAVGRKGESSALVAKGRDYGGGYGGGSMAYSTNYDTALTALAFLSFGVYLLNLLLMAMNRTAGRRRRDTEWEYQEGDVTSLEELGSVLKDSLYSYLFGSEGPECGHKYLCIAKESIKSHSESKSLLSSSQSLFKIISDNNLPGINILEKIAEENDCNSYEKTTSCFLVSKLEDALIKIKHKDKASINMSQERNESRSKRQSVFGNVNFASFWDAVQFLRGIFIPT